MKDLNLAEIGKTLKAAREKKGLSVEKACKLTRIQTRIMEALESGKILEVLDPVYGSLFLKKYASFLDLDADRLSAALKSTYQKKEEEKEEERKPAALKKEALPAMPLDRYIVPAGIVAVLLVLLFLALFLGTKLKNYMENRPARAGRVTAVQPKSDTKTAAAKDLHLSRASSIFPIPTSSPLTLTVKSAEDSWMRVRHDGSLAFEGILKKGESKSWSAADYLELWVGRAESLEFAVNRVAIGKIGSGTIKNIEITRRGIKIGNKWILEGK